MAIDFVLSFFCDLWFYPRMMFPLRLPPFIQSSLLFALAAVSLSGFVAADIALLMGVGFAFIAGSVHLAAIRKAIKSLLAISIIGLGAGMNLHTVLQAGADGFFYTAAGIAFALAAGFALGKLLRVEWGLSCLICVGTAICGGSAIAAVAPVIRAKEHHISVALGIVFILNAAGLVLFPFLGHLLDLPQEQFGLWSAMAIHDTSSVVGAGLQYGERALEVGTTTKLVRALWIVPVAFALQFVYNRFLHQPQAGNTHAKPKFPWFILGFIASAALVSFVPSLVEVGHYVALGARRLLVLTLFLIGTTLTLDAVKQVGLSPFVQGVLLWGAVSGFALLVIYLGTGLPAL